MFFNQYYVYWKQFYFTLFHLVSDIIQSLATNRKHATVASDLLC